MRDSKQNESWIIVFNDGSTKKITNVQADQILRLSSKTMCSGIEIDGVFYQFSTFAKVVPETKFEKQITDKQQFDQIDRFLKLAPKNRRKRALQEMRKGLLKYINSPDYQGTNKPLKLLEKIEYKIKVIEKNAAE